MAGNIQVNTELMQAAAQQSAIIADNMVTHAKTLAAGIEFVRENWRGQAGDAFRVATQDQSVLLNQVVGKLQIVSEAVKQAGQGFDSHDAGGGTKLASSGQQFLTGSLDF